MYLCERSADLNWCTANESVIIISMGLGGRGIKSEKRAIIIHWMPLSIILSFFLLVLLAIIHSSIHSHSQATQSVDLTNPNYCGSTIN